MKSVCKALGLIIGAVAFLIGLVWTGHYFTSYEYELKSKAEKGDAKAQYILGIGYFEDPDPKGYGVEYKPEEGLRLMTQAATQGYTQAQLELAEIYANLSGGTSDFYNESLALKWAKEAEKTNEYKAKKVLFHLYANGITFNKQLDLVRNWQDEVEQNGSPNEWRLLGEIYIEGRGLVERNLEKAAILLQKAKEGGVEVSDTLYGVLFQLGRYQQAAEIAKMQLNNEDTKGHYQFELAMMFFEGWGVEQDLAQSASFFQKAIENHKDYRLMRVAESFEDSHAFY